ncbi:MAG: HesB/IscA family protein [Fimbriiglobus sp.]
MSTAVAEQTELGLKNEAPKQIPNVTISAKAASEVARIMTEQGMTEKLYLRLRVVGGGCSGFQHKLDLDPTVNEKLDETFNIEGVDVVIDKRSMLYLGGVMVDFHDDLNKRGFSISNPHAKGTCGCGSSFSM